MASDKKVTVNDHREAMRKLTILVNQLERGEIEVEDFLKRVGELPILSTLKDMWGEHVAKYPHKYGRRRLLRVV